MLYTFLCQVFEYNFLLSFMFDTKVLRKIPESLLLVCYYLVTSKQNQTEFQTKKNPVYPRFFLNTQGIILSLYLFDIDGAMLSGQWIDVDGMSFYLTKSGVMAINAYIKADGKDLYYWVDADGKYQKEYDTSKPDLKNYDLAE